MLWLKWLKKPRRPSSMSTGTLLEAYEAEKFIKWQDHFMLKRFGKAAVNKVGTEWFLPNVVLQVYHYIVYYLSNGITFLSSNLRTLVDKPSADSDLISTHSSSLTISLWLLRHQYWTTHTNCPFTEASVVSSIIIENKTVFKVLTRPPFK